MTSTDLETLRSLLRRPASDSAVVKLTGTDPDQIERSAYQGFVELIPLGISVMFKEAPWVLPADRIVDPKALYVSAFQLHHEGHEGYSQYRGSMPAGVALGDTESALISKLGPPAAVGGGGISKTLKRPIARWLRYLLEDAILQFQLDDNDRVDLATLYVHDAKA